MIFIKADDWLKSILRCPVCNGKLREFNKKAFTCDKCSRPFYPEYICTGKHTEKLISFFPVSSYDDKWKQYQGQYEERSRGKLENDNEDMYVREVGGVNRIYTGFVDMKGDILDVGGHQGRLRFFLSEDDNYVSIDPFVNVFENMEQKINLLKVYPQLKKPCNFIHGIAEKLPFEDKSFDWVHMRSVIDHFYDADMALMEANRVTKIHGCLLLGNTVGSVSGGSNDDHIYRPTFDDLIMKLTYTNWLIDNIMWQTDTVVYIKATRIC